MNLDKIFYLLTSFLLTLGVTFAEQRPNVIFLMVDDLGPDGTSLAHFTSPTGLGEWTLVDAKAVDPNPDGGHLYGVGDATIAKIGDYYYIYCDRETKGSPYKVVAWRSSDLNQPFEFLGKAITPRSEGVDDWDNQLTQSEDSIHYLVTTWLDSATLNDKPQ